MAGPVVAGSALASTVPGGPVVAGPAVAGPVGVMVVGAEGVGSAVSGAALVPVDTLEGYVEWLPADPWRTGSSGFGRLNRAMPVTVREQPVPAAMAGPPSASLAYGG